MELYIGHEVIVRGIFVKNNNNLNFIQNNYISKKLTLLERKDDGLFYDVILNKVCNMVDINNLVSYNYGLFYESNYIDNNYDEDNNETMNITLGVMDIQPLFLYIDEDDINLIICLVRDYNDNIDNEYLYIDCNNYFDVVRTLNLRNKLVRNKRIQN